MFKTKKGKLIIFIGGAAAAGKSTLTNALVQNFNMFPYRNIDPFYELGFIRNIRDVEIFTKISEEDADAHFMQTCGQKRAVVSDVHYAIRPKTDSNLAVGITDGANFEETYKAALSYNLIRLLNKTRNIVFILLYAPPEILYGRAKKRDFNLIRARSLIDVKCEIAAEYAEWLRLSRTFDCISIKINTSINDLPCIIELLKRKLLL